MKCKECEYVENKKVCFDPCNRTKGENRCYETRIRKEMDASTCVYNCDWCRKNRKVRGL